MGRYVVGEKFSRNSGAISVKWHCRSSRAKMGSRNTRIAMNTTTGVNSSAKLKKKSPYSYGTRILELFQDSI
jgi:hypothetical protein